MARKLGTYPLSSNIEIEAGAPLDARTIVPLKADLTRAGSFSYSYVGMEVFVTEELQKYRLIGTNPELTDNWTKTDKGVVDGYYDAEHGGFYKDQGFTKPITGTSEVLYIDKSTDNVYRWNGSAFAQINPIDSQIPTIDMADERENIAQNDDVATIMGKIAKYFDDLGEVAFSDDYDDLDNTPTKLSEFENDPGYITDEGIVTSVKVGNTSYDPVEGVVSLPQYPDISGKADKATTLAGYGITDAKIANGTITLGSNTITPLTQHQDISGKADKATTLAGYGITDAKIANGTITLGANTITPVTDISGKADKATTLAGYGITDAKIANGTITLGSNTITPVTDVSGKADKATTLAGYGITDAKIASGTITLGSNSITPLTQHQDISGKADKATTLAGYGITDAKIANGTITLGTNTITPLTQHQDISGKADKATTLAGYGITDAKIASGTITLGSNTITPLTQHQSVTDNNPTLSWGTKSKVATIGSTAINVTMPSNPNTDTKVTSAGNHYAPAEDSTAQLDADASSSTAATWNSTSLVTGVTVKRDAKGHVTGLAVDSIKMPANPNTNTTYTFADGTNGFTVTPSGGTAQTVKVTPSITNNVTGSGTSGYLAKFNGANTITSGPQLGSGTTTYLRNDGSWATPTDTNTTYTISTGDSNGQIKVTPSSGSAYNVGVKGLGSNAYTSTAYVPIRKNTDTYTTLASYYSGGTTPTYVRIAFPEGVANIWFMLNMEIFIRRKYSTDTAGKIIVNVHHGTGSPGTWTGNAITYGLPTDVRVYGSDGRYIYIIAIESYTTVVINSAIVGDAARSVDLSGTTIDNVTEIPTTYQTFTMQRGIDTSNYTDYTVKKDGTGASGSWGISITGNAATATKATQDDNGDTIKSTYMKKGVDYVTAGKASGTSTAAYATAEGYGNTSSGRYSHAEGYCNTVTDDAQEAHVEGWNSTVSANGAHAEGLHTTASGLAAHAEGSYFETYISGVGYQYYNLASGEGSHVEGLGTLASGTGAHAEGSAYKVSNSVIQPTSASGDGAHAEGLATTAAGNYSHSEGFLTHADGNYSHAEGDHTYASSDYQHVEGKYNVLDTNGTYAHIIGGGTDSTRKNIFTVDWTGNTTIAGSLIVPGNDNYGIFPASDDYGFVGSEDKRFYKMAATDICARRTVYLGSENTYYGASGSLVMCHKSSAYHSEMVPSNFTASRTLTIPDETGTLATREWIGHKVEFHEQTFNNVAVTTRSANGAYYTGSPPSVTFPTGFSSIGAITIVGWSGCTYPPIPYISGGNKMGIYSHGSMTCGQIIARFMFYA